MLRTSCSENGKDRSSGATASKERKGFAACRRAFTRKVAEGT